MDKVRWKIVYFSPQIIQDWIIEGNVMPSHSVKCLKGIPEGSKFVKGWFSFSMQVYGAIFEHPDFPEYDRETFSRVASFDDRFLPTVEVLLQSIYEENGITGGPADLEDMAHE